MLKNKRIYLLPNALTLISLFCGFRSILNTFEHQYLFACQAIFIGLIFDSLDGRIARFTNTQTEFGAQFDSLSDLITFGAAPAILCYIYSFNPGSSFSFLWLPCFLLLATAAIRLARFNTLSGIIDKRYFQGLPTPASACFIAATIALYENYNYVLKSSTKESFLIGLMTILSFLMISSVPFPSFKDSDYFSKTKRKGLFLIALIIGMFWFEPYIAIFFILFSYIFANLAFYFFRKIIKKN